MLYRKIRLAVIFFMLFSFCINTSVSFYSQSIQDMPETNSRISHLDLLATIRGEIKIEEFEKLLDEIEESNKAEILKSVKIAAWTYAIETGNLGYLRYLFYEGKFDIRKIKYDNNQNSIYYAAKFGKMDIVKFLMKKTSMPVTKDAIYNLMYYDKTLYLAIYRNPLIKDLVDELVEYIKNNIRFSGTKFDAEEEKDEINKGILSKIKEDIEGFIKDNYEDGDMKKLKDIIELRVKNIELLRCAIKGDLAKLRFLIENGADVNAQDREEVSALHYAVQRGHMDIIKYLVDVQDANVNVRDNNGTPPMFLILGHDKMMDVLEYLVDKINFDIKDNSGRTFFDFLCVNGYLETIEYLIDKNEISKEQQKHGLILAAAHGKLNIMKYLIEGKELDIGIKDDMTGNSLLASAILWKKPRECLNYLASQGIDFQNDENALGVAIESGKETKTVEWLLEKGVHKIDRKKYLLNRKLWDSYFKSRLKVLLDEKYIDKFELSDQEYDELLDITIDVKDYDSSLKLIRGRYKAFRNWKTISSGSFMFNDRLCAGKELSDEQHRGFWRLMKTKEPNESKLEKIKNFVEENKLDINADYGKGETLLHIACLPRFKNKGLVEYCLGKNAKVNVVNQENLKLPLHYACQSGDNEIIDLLLNHHAIAFLPDSDGREPVYYLLHSGNRKKEITNKLLPPKVQDLVKVAKWFRGKGRGVDLRQIKSLSRDEKESLKKYFFSSSKQFVFIKSTERDLVKFCLENRDSDMFEELFLCLIREKETQKQGLIIEEQILEIMNKRVMERLKKTYRVINDQNKIVKPSGDKDIKTLIFLEGLMSSGNIKKFLMDKDRYHFLKDKVYPTISDKKFLLRIKYDAQRIRNIFDRFITGKDIGRDNTAFVQSLGYINIIEKIFNGPRKGEGVSKKDYILNTVCDNVKLLDRGLYRKIDWEDRFLLYTILVRLDQGDYDKITKEKWMILLLGHLDLGAEVSRNDVLITLLRREETTKHPEIIEYIIFMLLKEDRKEGIKRIIYSASMIEDQKTREESLKFYGSSIKQFICQDIMEKIAVCNDLETEIKRLDRIKIKDEEESSIENRKQQIGVLKASVMFTNNETEACLQDLAFVNKTLDDYYKYMNKREFVRVIADNSLKQGAIVKKNHIIFTFRSDRSVPLTDMGVEEELRDMSMKEDPEGVAGEMRIMNQGHESLVTLSLSKNDKKITSNIVASKNEGEYKTDISLEFIPKTIRKINDKYGILRILKVLAKLDRVRFRYDSRNRLLLETNDEQAANLISSA